MVTQEYSEEPQIPCVHMNKVTWTGGVCGPRCIQTRGLTHRIGSYN